MKTIIYDERLVTSQRVHASAVKRVTQRGINLFFSDKFY